MWSEDKIRDVDYLSKMQKSELIWKCLACWSICSQPNNVIEIIMSRNDKWTPYCFQCFSRNVAVDCSHKLADKIAQNQNLLKN